jgi:ubiquinone biosynthesis protein Coq4
MEKEMVLKTVIGNIVDGLKMFTSLGAWTFFGLFPNNTYFFFIMSNLQDDLYDKYSKEKVQTNEEELYRKFVNKDKILNWNRLEIGKLKSMPANSVGKLFYDYLVSNNLNPDFYNNRKEKHFTAFKQNRIRKLHDFFHFILEKDTSFSGEMFVQGFTYAQCPNPQPIMSLIGTLLRVTMYSKFDEVDELLNSFIKGREIGNNSVKLILTFDWDLVWERDLEEVKKELMG